MFFVIKHIVLAILAFLFCLAVYVWVRKIKKETDEDDSIDDGGY